LSFLTVRPRATSGLSRSWCSSASISPFAISCGRGADLALAAPSSGQRNGTPHHREDLAGGRLSRATSRTGKKQRRFSGTLYVILAALDQLHLSQRMTSFAMNRACCVHRIAAAAVDRVPAAASAAAGDLGAGLAASLTAWQASGVDCETIIDAPLVAA
jgi:hypothetical protein